MRAWVKPRRSASSAMASESAKYSKADVSSGFTSGKNWMPNSIAGSPRISRIEQYSDVQYTVNRPEDAMAVSELPADQAVRRFPAAAARGDGERDEAPEQRVLVAAAAGEETVRPEDVEADD